MKTLPILAFAGLALSACAALPPPSPAEMAAVPVVRYGEPAPAGQAFVLHYPAGAPLPVTTAVGGNLLEREGRGEFQVSLKRDVYVYKNWASFDGKTWQRGNALVAGKIAMTLPGEADGRSPGSLSATFDLK